MNQEVVVNSVAESQVETTNGQIASTITGKQIENIALNGRNYVQLLRLLPGTVSATLDPFAIQLGAQSTYVNGVRGASVLNMVDGILLQDVNANISVIAVPNADSIAETRVLAASFSAENPSPYGGATINAVTKSGGQVFHGNIFEFNRNTLFNAKPDFATTRLPLHFNDYGFTLGGPIYLPGHSNSDKKKLFFFVSEEWKLIHTNTVGSGTVPTADQRIGIFTTPVFQPGTKTLYASGSCTQRPSVLNTAATGYCVPQAAFSVNGPKLVAPYPLPNLSVGGTNYSVNLASRLDNREDRYNLDYSAGPKDLISIRFAKNGNISSATGALGIVPVITTPRPSFVYSVGYTHTFTSNLLNSLVIGETHNKFQNIPDLRNLSIAALGLTYQQPFPVNVLGSGPTVAITGFTGISPSNADTKTNENLILSDDLSWVKGRHTLKFGTYIQHAKSDEHNLNATTTQGSVTFSTSTALTSGNALADTLLGNFNQYVQSSIPGYLLLRYQVSEFYAQDNWHANKRLAVEYGIRYSYSQPPYSAINNMSFFNPFLYSPALAPTVSTTNGALSGNYDLYNGIQIVGTGFTPGASGFFPSSFLTNPSVTALFSGGPRGFSQTPKTNVAPRAGVAIDVFGNGKTSIRAGYGIFFMRAKYIRIRQRNAEPTLQFASIDFEWKDRPARRHGWHSFSDQRLQFSVRVQDRIHSDTKPGL